MSTKELEKIVRNLSSELTQLKSFVISVAGRDKEGAYNPSIIQEISTAKTEKPSQKYTGRGSLLKLLKDQK